MGNASYIENPNNNFETIHSKIIIKPSLIMSIIPVSELGQAF